MFVATNLTKVVLALITSFVPWKEIRGTTSQCSTCVTMYKRIGTVHDDVITTPTNGSQDLHENLLRIGDAAFPGLSNQNELN